jgi:4-oxalocrotonate tautomerase
MPIIRVEMFKGRSREQKRALARELTEACIRALACKPESVTIVLKDVDKEDWAVAGTLVADRVAD